MPSKRTIRSISLAVLLLVPACFSGRESGKPRSAEKAAAPKPAPKTLTAADVEGVLANAANENSLALFQAASKAMGSKRREDAAFLFFAAQIRARGDLKAFPPVGRGGNSPGVLLSALRHEIGSVINPAIMRDRDGYSRVLARLEKWTPRYNPGYVPG